MATLEALAISGIRSYNPEKLQRIDFTHPITLINGKNGSGKTTIIQCLKYVTTGVKPALINRQNCFVMDPSIAGTAEVQGDIRLRFRTAKNRVVIAKKVLMVSKKQNKKNLQSKAIQLSLKTKDEDGKQISVSQNCTDIQKQIPQMLGISKPILNNIVFCHQDDSLWPFSENNVLKNIFDELFDTKRFTKSLQNLKEALKDYEKEKTQLKAQLQFLKMGYTKFSENQTDNLTGLVQLVETSQKLSQIRSKLEQSKSKFKQSNGQENENELIQQKGVLGYKLNEVKSKIEKIKQKAKSFQIDLTYNLKGSDGSVKLQPDQNQIYKELQRVGEDIEEGQKELNMLNRLFQQLKDKQAKSRRVNELGSEISRLKQLMTQLQESKNAHNPELLMKEAQIKVRNLKKVQQSIKQIKSKLSKIPNVAPFYPQSQITDPSKLQSKINSIKIERQRVEKRIRCMYGSLYSSNIKDDDYLATGQGKRAAERLARLQAQVQLKKSQLKKYQQMKPRSKSFERQIYEYQYTYIDLQTQMLNYMKRKKECGMCMKKLTDDELQAIKRKVTKTIAKGQQKIEQLKQSYNPISDVDPTPFIQQIQKFIKDSASSMKNLEEQKNKYDRYMQAEQNRQLNRQLNKLMASAELKSEMTRYDKTQVSSIEKFRQLIAEYKSYLSQEKAAIIELNRAREQYNSYQKQQAEAANAIKQRTRLQSTLIELEPQVKYLAMIENIIGKIAELLKIVKKDEQKNSSSDESSSQLVNKIDSLEMLLEEKRQKKSELQMKIQYRILIEQEKQLQKTFVKVAKMLMQLQKNRTQNNQLIKQRSELQLQQAIINQKYRSQKAKCMNNNLIQVPPYLQKLLRYNTLCSLVSDIQTSVKCMERATNRLHNEKMDLINKILFDIWQEVYHAKDIQFIRIDAIAERKAAGYGYSIKMKKNGQMLDMKGRCSMGQKVLASIIIRMALAQAFSSSAHILTLDQPTTNLDRIHIQNLAESISSIIEMQQNSRLQLVIISHDMQFIKLLKKHTNYYYEICRDQRNFSVINRREISELGNQGRMGGIQAIHY